MRSVLVVLLLTGFALSGCADTASFEPQSEVPHEDHAEHASNVTLESFTAILDLPVEVGTGVPFNVTIQTTLPDDVKVNATWIIEVFAATADVADNNTAATSNGTADDDGNATTGANATVAPMPAALMAVNGTGVPAMAEFNLTEAGNLTFVATVSAAGFDDASAEALLSVLAGATGPAFDDPPEPLVFEGTVSGTMLNVGLAGCDNDDETYTFVAGAHRAMRFVMDVDDGETGADLDWSIKGAGGESHSDDAIGTEAPKKFDLPTPGEWAVTITCYTSWQSTDYTVTVEFE